MDQRRYAEQAHQALQALLRNVRGQALVNQRFGRVGSGQLSRAMGVTVFLGVSFGRRTRSRFLLLGFLERLE